MLPFTDLQSLTNDQHKSVLETNDNFVDLQPPPTKKKERKKKIPAGQRVAGLENVSESIAQKILNALMWLHTGNF